MTVTEPIFTKLAFWNGIMQ